MFLQVNLNTILFFVLLGILASCKNRQNFNDKAEKEVVLRLEPGEGNPRNSEGDFIPLNDGRILFIYTKFTGGASDHAHAHLASRISSDKGKTWSSRDIEVVPNEAVLNVMSVSLLRLNDGRIALFYLRKNSVSDCIPFMRISNNETNTWSKPHRCIDTTGYFVLNNDRVIQLKNGRIIMPVALHALKGAGIDPNAAIMCYFSDDYGVTWHKSNQVENQDNITLQEPGVCELNDGKLLLYCRTNKGVQYFSRSDDFGENWTPVIAGNIKSPLSPASVKRIPKTGDLLLIWNNNGIDEKAVSYTHLTLPTN